MTFKAGLFHLLLIQAVLGRSNDFLAPNWGSDISPSEINGTRITLQVDQFTEYNNDTIPFPFKEKQTTCELYCRTIGFIHAGISHTFESKSDLKVNIGGLFGIANDAISEYLQNDYRHARDEIGTVPRDGVREGVLYGVSGELNRAIANFTAAFYGVGTLVNNTYSEVYIHSGLWNNTYDIIKKVAGLKYSLTTRLGIHVPMKEFLFSGEKYFQELFSASHTTQIETGIFINIRKIPVAFSWRASYSTGMFKNEKTGHPVGIFFEGLKTQIWKFSLERYNDSLNKTDYGPTYGIKLNFVISLECPFLTPVGNQMISRPTSFKGFLIHT